MSIIKLNCSWFDPINFEIAIASGSARKAPTVEQSKPSPKTCVMCYEKASVAELTKPRDVEWYLLNYGQQFQGQLNWKMLPFCSTKTSQKYQMYHITWNIERHLQEKASAD